MGRLRGVLLFPPPAGGFSGVGPPGSDPRRDGLFSRRGGRPRRFVRGGYCAPPGLQAFASSFVCPLALRDAAARAAVASGVRLVVRLGIGWRGGVEAEGGQVAAADADAGAGAGFVSFIL